jgi:AhpD family alkylhydroperoxidase
MTASSERFLMTFDVIETTTSRDYSRARRSADPFIATPFDMENRLSTFPVYDIDNAPEKSGPILCSLKEFFGFVPNIAGAMAGSPTLINGFISVFQNAHSGSFSEAQVQLLLLTNAVTNACDWAVAFHTHLALQQGVTPEDVEAIRVGLLPSDAKHAALSSLARRLIERRDHVEAARLRDFLDSGFAREQVLEVILVVSASTITNYVGTVALPPLEQAFAQHAWQDS